MGYYQMSALHWPPNNLYVRQIGVQRNISVLATNGGLATLKRHTSTWPCQMVDEPYSRGRPPLLPVKC